MKQIKQTIQYEGPNDMKLRRDLTAWNHQHTVSSSGIDWQFEYMWANLTDEDCLAFCLKHPEYSMMFKEVL